VLCIKVFFSYFVIGKLAMAILLVPFEENRYCFTDADEQNLKRVHCYSEQLL